MKKNIAIISAVRTPIGSFGGVFKNISAVDLGTIVVKAAIERAGINPDQVDEVIFGNVLSAGLGQNIARQIAIKANIPESSSAFNVSKVCGSGLKSVILGAQSIICGDADIVVVGGTESMSNAAYASKETRFGAKMGNVSLVDTLINDGLTDAFSGVHMGITAENLAEKYNLTREDLDSFSLQSQIKAENAQKAGKFKNEIVPVTLQSRKGEEIIENDEYPKHGSTIEGLSKLRPAFKKDGVVTAGNSSGINDGAAALVLMSEEKATSLGLKPLAIICSWASAGVDPQLMGFGPVPASEKALKKAGLKISDIDLVEANEAFAAQSLSVIKALGLNPDKTNVNGGAIALGHPIGASGARILVSLIHEMNKQNAKNGLATLCIGGGQGLAMIISR